MTNFKCLRCGSFNLVGGPICKTCGIDFALVAEPFPYPEVRGSFAADQVYSSSTTMSSIGPFDDVGDVLGPTLNLFVRNLWLITKIVFVIVAPFELFRVLNVSQFGNDWQLYNGIFVLDFLCKVLIAPALIYSMMSVLQTGVAPGVNEAYRWGLGKFGQLIFCAAMVTVLQAVGTAMCFVPGLIVAVVFALVYPLAVLEKGSAVEILSRSAELTKGHRWKIFGAQIVVLLITLLIRVPTTPWFGLLTDAVWPLQVAAAILLDIVDQGMTVLSLIIYLSIRRTLAVANSVIQ